jgi:hypothetical protein
MFVAAEAYKMFDEKSDGIMYVTKGETADSKIPRIPRDSKDSKGFYCSK